MSAHTPIDDTPITSLEQLRDYMLLGAKPEERWVIGTEHEKLGWMPSESRNPTYGGPKGIGQLLSSFEAEGWVATREGAAIIALTKNKASITLEPGGQLELSGAPLRTLAEMARETDAHLADVRRLSEPLGLTWHGLGSSPTPPDACPKMPKGRYEVMRRYLPTQGRLALHMMHATCTVQCNLDYRDEADAMKKLRAGLYLQPVVMAAFANSFTLDQRLRDGSCARSQIWLHTDPSRYHYPASFLAPHTPLLAYVEWAVRVPMFFIAREGKYIDCAGLPFERFMREGFKGHTATVGDFALHLSTLFPDTRLKQHLEVRGADMSDVGYTKALSALHVGLLYDARALEGVLAMFEHITAEQLWATRAAVDEQGLRADLGGRPLLAWARDLTALAREGLSRWEPESAHLLDPLEENLRAGRCPADLNRPLWARGMEALMAGTRIC
jgi:glutamate--cysteine ligase